ncbi:MAG TPA: hypothetical protein VFT02_10365 [Pyrinomonadaceae bacterium]|nr:hypothetical protein [Pyrinomonadaceae bacterium]
MRPGLKSIFVSAFIFLFPLALASGIVVAQNRSTYTSLTVKNCRTIKTETTGAGDYEGRCRGVAGYSLTLLEGDLRQNIIVNTPKGAKHSLELWDVISGGFSHVGPKAEWRMTRQNGKLQPAALIIRYNASENPDNPNKHTSYLAVAKITPTEICITDKISAGPNANVEARRAADSAATKPCLKTNP